ncbi:MAG: MarR family transcriptional regulator [Acidothermus sp.]|nr:MarR family transcriptional regulator [Acidothermus sp.]MCL6537303.1 MarR family transcriptional regulator [Acidothermus sp.]
MRDDRDAELVSLLDRLLWALRRAAPMPESATALSILDILDREGPLRVSDLVVRERISQPGMTQLACRLERSGLVRRGGDPLDGRVTIVAITERGRRFLHEFRRQRATTLADALATLPAEQVDRLRESREALRALNGALLERSARPRGEPHDVGTRIRDATAPQVAAPHPKGKSNGRRTRVSQR